MNKVHIDNWDEFFMRQVYLVGSKSKDKSTQIGAILIRDGTVISQGYNGICRKVNDNVFERNERPEKYHWYEHAERNAIYNAARNGIKTLDSTMFTNYPPCTDCGRAVIQAGIKEIVFHKQWSEVWDKIKSSKWDGHDNKTLTMFKEANIEVRWLNMKLEIQCLISERLSVV